MRIFRHVNDLPNAATGCVLAIGNFDGVHSGHRAVLEAAATIAKAARAPLAALTFTPHPRRYFNPHLPPLAIIPLRDKWQQLALTGIDTLFHLRFDERIANLDAAAFVQFLLADTLHVRGVVTGEDFGFGKHRNGNPALLATLAKEHDFTYHSVPPLIIDGAPCSSSRIREALSIGAIAQASALLGRPYTLSGRVRKGDQRGRTLGFPTANIGLEHLFAPAMGVYAVKATLPDGREVGGVANLGVRPSFGGDVTPTLEVHCFDTQETLYGKRLSVRFVRYLREERRFETPDVLKMQIARDCMAARQYV